MGIVIFLLTFLSVVLIVYSLVPQRNGLLAIIGQVSKKVAADKEIPPWVIPVAGAVGMFLLVTLIFQPVYGLITAPVGFLLAKHAPKQIAKWRLYFYRKKLLDEMEGACMVIASTVRGGLTLLDAYRTTAGYVKSPLKEEFQIIVDQVQYGGKSMGEAVGDFAKRWKAQEIEMLAHATNLAARVGGKDVPRIMTSVSNSIRERKQIDKKIKAKTTYQRISGFMISAVPILILGVFKLMSPDIYDTLMNEGRIFLVAGIAFTVIGWYLIFKIMNIEEF